jgi:hypothetical protein
MQLTNQANLRNLVIDNGAEEGTFNIYSSAAPL